MLTLSKTIMLKRYFLILLLIAMPIQAAEEEKEEENLAEAVAEMAPDEVEKPSLEKDISTQIEKYIKTGEVVWLGEADATFLALYKANTFQKTHGAILFLHDIGANANWTKLIKPLRLAFPKKGWHTLSIQLPMVKIDEPKIEYLSQFDESVSRINAGIEYLKQKSPTNIVVLGHGMGAVAAVFDLNQNPQEAVKALVTMSLSGAGSLVIPQDKEALPLESLGDQEPDAEADKDKKDDAKKEEKTEDTTSLKEPATEIPKRDLFAEIVKIKIPFLDIYAQQDYQDVMRDVVKRQELMEQSGNPDYSQSEIEGADHYYRGLEDLLVKKLRGWLKKQVVEKNPPMSPNS